MSDQLLHHGGALDLVKAMFPDAPEPWLDLSTGINPHAYPFDPPSKEAITHLPTRSAFEKCKAVMARVYGAPTKAILPTPGSEIVIRLLPTLLQGEKIAVPLPTYGDHVEVWQNAGRQVVQVSNPLETTDNADIVIVCNPNNPDGRRWSVEELRRCALQIAQQGKWLIVDEAYADLAPDQSVAHLAGQPGLIVLRSIGKFYGLAGLRLGAVLAPQEVLQSLEELLGVWAVSGPALEVGARALDDDEWAKQTRQNLNNMRNSVDTVLDHAGMKVFGGTDLFRYVEVADAEQVWRRLAEQGIYVRPFSWSDKHLRIGLPKCEAELQRLARALSL